ncbi:MAG: hypothetical protein U0Q18_17620 [Bryobacteraceae bacterium]
MSQVVDRIKDAVGAKRMVLGGGNVKSIEKLPPDTSLGDSRNAFMGGFRPWDRKSKALPALSFWEFGDSDRCRERIS